MRTPEQVEARLIQLRTYYEVQPKVARTDVAAAVRVALAAEEVLGLTLSGGQLYHIGLAVSALREGGRWDA